MKVLVTGGTGYLGRAVVLALAARGHAPVVFARTASRSGLPGDLIDGDVRDGAGVARAVEGCDAVCHMAALVTLWRRRAADFDDVNVGGLERVLDAAARAGIGRIVYTSSFLARPPRGQTAPIQGNDYQRTKVAAEAVAETRVALGAPIVRVYPGVVYGPGVATEGNLIGRLVGDQIRGRLPGLVGADRDWSYAFVDDVAVGHCEALERGRPGGRYELGGTNAPQRRLFEIVANATGCATPRRIPYPVATAIAWEEEWRARLTGGTPMLTRGTVQIFRHDWPLDSSAAIADLGYTVTPLPEGVGRMLESIRTQPPGSRRTDA